MKKNFKKAFSMIELLFVMVILAALAAIAIPNMSSGTEAATLTAMKSDAKNMFNEVLAIKAKSRDELNSNVLGEGIGIDTNVSDNRYNTTTGIFSAYGMYFNITKGNIISAVPKSCDPAAGIYSDVEITIQNPNYKSGIAAVILNSCNGKLKVVDDLSAYYGG